MSGIRNKTSIGTVGQQVELFEDGLPDQHFVAQHHRFFEGVVLPLKVVCFVGAVRDHQLVGTALSVPETVLAVDRPRAEQAPV